MPQAHPIPVIPPRAERIVSPPVTPARAIDTLTNPELPAPGSKDLNGVVFKATRHLARRGAGDELISKAVAWSFLRGAVEIRGEGGGRSLGATIRKARGAPVYRVNANCALASSSMTGQRAD